MDNLSKNVDKFTIVRDKVIPLNSNNTTPINDFELFDIKSGRFYILSVSLRSEASAWCHYGKIGTYYHPGTYPTNVKGPQIKWLHEVSLINAQGVSDFTISLSMEEHQLKMTTTGTASGPNGSCFLRYVLKELDTEEYSNKY